MAKRTKHSSGPAKHPAKPAKHPVKHTAKRHPDHNPQGGGTRVQPPSAEAIQREKDLEAAQQRTRYRSPKEMEEERKAAEEKK